MTNISRSINQKLSTLSGVLLALLLCLTSCEKERFVPEEDLGYRHTAPDEGSTYMSLALRGSNPPASSQPQTEDQTGGNYQVTWQGDDIIDNFAVFIVSNGENKVTCIAGKVTDDKVVEKWDPAKQELLLKPFRSAPVNKQVFAFFNIPQQYLTYLGEKLDNKKEFLERIAEPIPYIGASGITYGSQDAPTLEAFRPDSHIATKLVSRDASGQREKIPDLMSFAVHGRPSVPGGPRPRGRADYPTEYFDIKRMSNTKEAVDPPFFKRSDRIMSSGVKESYLPEDNITEEEVKEHGRNLVQIYTRRVLAQAVVTVDATLVEEGIATLKNMELKSVSFQVLNFEPSFYPIAQTNDGKLPGNKNTLTPLSDKNDNTKLVNFSTYPMSVTVNGEAEQFNIGSLMRDRFFRTAHIVYDEVAPTELDPSDKDYAQKLLRQTTFEKKGGATVVDDETLSGATAPSQPTTFFGSCYVTETTHHWAADPSSGYKTTNTPFFAVVAAFDLKTLPWSSTSQDIVLEKKINKQKDFDKMTAGLQQQIKDKKERLKQLTGGSGGGDGDPWAAAQAKFQEWVDYCTSVIGPTALKYDRDRINKIREDYAAGTIANRAEFDKKVARNYSKVNNVVARNGADASKKETDLWAEIKRLDEERENNPNQEEINKLSNEIKELEKELKRMHDAFFASEGWYPSKEDERELFTPSVYEQGINRIYYSQVDGKFYLNYHEIPSANRGDKTHTLTMSDPWITEMKEKLTSHGYKIPTRDNGASGDAAVPELTQDLLDKLSKVMNGVLKESELTIPERHAMDFYLYGRIYLGAVDFFGGRERADALSIQFGYVPWYTAKNADRVVSYPCYVRSRVQTTGGVNRARMFMVYYAWLNPNTQESSTTYASPVLRNNIYHMHINGFTRMGLSAIPFVPRQSEDSPYYFLHGAFDPDEQVPTLGAALNATGGTGSPTSLSTPRSTSFSLTF